ncbi:MAG: methyltransferase domain-containing protein [Burkholderiales bacterium]|nr:methyltransferase domain-containing protein [Burkholderiales bacterium]
MAVPPTVAAPEPAQGRAALPNREPARERAALGRRLRKLERVFAIEQIRREPLAGAEVVEYYEHCHDAYRKYHSAAGAVHMALNDGDRFDADGFYGQLRRIEQGWGERPRDVLELAYGQGFNLAYLAQRHPARRFAGIDLTPAHREIAAARLHAAGLTNVELALGDFHQLPYADASFDAVFCIEAFCYARDLPRALAEVARVLRPGGLCTLFDGYLPRPPAALDADAALAVELVARGMAIEGLQVEGEFLAAARAAGLQCVASAARDAQVMPSLRKLERITGAVIRFPWLGRRALERRNRMRGRNILAGYLMRGSVALGLIGYRQFDLRKES